MIIYEFPVNERIRTFLRLESLYKRVNVFLEQDFAEIHHVALLTIFEILEVTSRSELKSEVIQELEKQRLHLTQFKGNPSVEEDAVSNLLSDIKIASDLLLKVPGKTGQEIRQNDWLSSIRQRTSIPGGVCQFDLPSYHYWLSGKADSRKKDLIQWLSHFNGLAKGIIVILKILRESGNSQKNSSENGGFQKTLSGKMAQLIRVKIDPSMNIVPEVSANKYLLNIRFTVPGDIAKRKTSENVDFELCFCNLL